MRLVRSVAGRLAIMVAIPITALALMIGGQTWLLSQACEETNSVMQNDVLPILDEEVRPLIARAEALQLILEADRDVHQALIAEKMGAVAKTKDELAKQVATSQENIGQARDRVQKASALFGCEAASKLVVEFNPRLAQWEAETGKILQEAANPATLAAAQQRATENATAAAFDNMRDVLDKITEELVTVNKAVGETTETRIGGAQASVDGIVADLTWLQKTWLTVGIVVIAAVVVLAVWVLRNLVRNLAQVIRRLRESGATISQSADQFERSSQELSSGAAEQAASLEETSASLEEISGQTQGNAESAEQAANAVADVAAAVRHSADDARRAESISADARTAAQEGAKAIDEITSSMSAIREGSDKIADIIQVIDDITHQTKMLATNAAIEAARAGDQGKGFAVVADEVSKLAENSKTSAKEIADLIRDTVRKSQIGSELAERGTGVLREILDKATEVAQLVGEMAAASEKQAEQVEGVGNLMSRISQASAEQAGGVGQVTKAVAQMDQVTQRTAANAEESAAASQELNAQVQVLNQVVQEMVALMTGTVNERTETPTTDEDRTGPERGFGLAVKAKGIVGGQDEPAKTRAALGNRMENRFADTSHQDELKDF